MGDIVRRAFAIAVVVLGVALGGAWAMFMQATFEPAIQERPPIDNMRCPVCNEPESDPFDGDHMYLKIEGIPDPRVMFCENKHTWRGDTGEQIRLVP